MPERIRWARYDRSDPNSVWFAIEDIREVLSDMATSDEIAERVTAALHRERFMMVGWGGKLIGLAVAVGTVATAVHVWF